jgi:hypothetical protein
MSRRKSTKKVRKRRQMNGKKGLRTDRGRVKGRGLGGWA